MMDTLLCCRASHLTCLQDAIDLDLARDSSTGALSRNLVLKPGILTPGVIYRFGLNAADEFGVGIGEIQIVMNTPPSGETPCGVAGSGSGSGQVPLMCVHVDGNEECALCCCCRGHIFGGASLRDRSQHHLHLTGQKLGRRP